MNMRAPSLSGFIHLVTPWSFPLLCALRKEAVMRQFYVQHVIRIAELLAKSHICHAGVGEESVRTSLSVFF